MRVYIILVISVLLNSRETKIYKVFCDKEIARIHMRLRAYHLFKMNREVDSEHEWEIQKINNDFYYLYTIGESISYSVKVAEFKCEQ